MKGGLQPKLSIELWPIGPPRNASDPQPMTHNVATWMPCTLTALVHGNLAVFIVQYNQLVSFVKKFKLNMLNVRVKLYI